MTSLITKTSLELELQISFSAGYTDAFFTKLCNWADSMLQLKTNRSTFSGVAADIAEEAEIAIAVDRLARSHPDLIKASISSISENGGSISFNNGKNLETYRRDFMAAVSDLKLPGAGNYDITMPDIEGTHTSSDTNPLY